MKSLSDSYTAAMAFDPATNGKHLVSEAERITKEFFTPSSDYSVWGSKEECHTFGIYSGAKIERDRRAQVDECVANELKTGEQVGGWMCAALDDDKVCEEMKRDIRAWFDALTELRKAVEGMEK